MDDLQKVWLALDDEIRVLCGTLLEQLEAENEHLKRERDAAVKELFCWVGCPVCKYWDHTDEWCEKYDRPAESCDSCDSPEWRGV